MIATNIVTEPERVQRVIDKYRALGVEIKVNHEYEAMYPETTISIAFNDKFDAWEIGYMIQDHLAVSPDTGSGFGWRDLQLNRLLPGIE